MATFHQHGAHCKVAVGDVQEPLAFAHHFARVLQLFVEETTAIAASAVVMVQLPCLPYFNAQGAELFSGTALSGN